MYKNVALSLLISSFITGQGFAHDSDSEEIDYPATPAPNQLHKRQRSIVIHTDPSSPSPKKWRILTPEELAERETETGAGAELQHLLNEVKQRMNDKIDAAGGREAYEAGLEAERRAAIAEAERRAGIAECNVAETLGTPAEEREKLSPEERTYFEQFQPKLRSWKETKAGL